MKNVYIFRGAPASGKNAIVSGLGQILPKPAVLIEQDKLRWGFHLFGRSIQDIEDEEHMLAYRNTVLLYEQYLKSGKYTVVLEGLFTWDDASSSQGNARELIELARKHGFSGKSVVLKADKDELIRRNKDRKYSVPSDEFETLYKNVYSKIDASEFVIDSTAKSIEETVAEISKIITS